ncbi:MAG: hypothetical protein U0931_15520 [Vulcanimicrobiota bacterium]
MQISPLPEALVPYLDSLKLGYEPVPDSYLLYLQGLEQLRLWYHFQGSLEVNAQDRVDLDNLDLLLSQLEAGETSPLPALYLIADLMEAIGRRRDSANFSAQPAVNDLILACAAWTEGKAASQAVSIRLSRAGQYFSNLAKAYALERSQLRAEAAQAFDQGLELLALAHREVGQKLAEGCDLRPALRGLREGAEVMQLFLDWQRERPETHCQRWNLPVIGGRLETSLKALDEESADPGWTALVWQELLENQWPRLDHFWARGRFRVYLQAEERRRVLAEIDEGLLELQAALQSQDRPLLEEILDFLSENFQFIHDNVLPSRHLQSSDLGDLLEVLVQTLQGLVPIQTLETLLQDGPDSLSCFRNPRHTQKLAQPNRLIVQYCASGDDEFLHQAILSLLASSPPRPEPKIPNSWTCPFCLNPNPLGQRQCQNCSQLPRRVW